MNGQVSSGAANSDTPTDAVRQNFTSTDAESVEKKSTKTGTLDPIPAKFFELQFEALREEIENSKERAFRIYTIGALVVPAAQQILQYLVSKSPSTPTFSVDEKVTAVRVLFPFFVLCVMFLFMAENRDIKRCARYIREHIELAYLNSRASDRDLIGWETWLAASDGSSMHTSNTNTRKTNSGPQYAAGSSTYYLVFTISCLAMRLLLTYMVKQAYLDG